MLKIIFIGVGAAGGQGEGEQVVNVNFILQRSTLFWTACHTFTIKNPTYVIYKIWKMQ